MGFLNFLKPKKKAEAAPAQGLPPMPSDAELYSELPNLPEAPEATGLPELELPQPPKGFEDLELPEEKKGAELPESVYMPGQDEKFNPQWLKSQEYESKLKPQLSFPELPSPKPELEPKSWLNIPAEVPDLKAFPPEENHEDFASKLSEGKLISRNNSFFLKAEDFRMARDGLDKIARIQKKHHNLTLIKKEENAHYERINSITEEIQRKLMHIDRTLFD